MLRDRLVRNRDQRTDALTVACDHRGLRTAVVTQDLPVVTRAQRGYRGSGFVLWPESVAATFAKDVR